MSKITEGIIPAALGTVVSGTGAVLASKKIAPKFAAGMVGFGLAHMVLGSIDYVQHNSKNTSSKDRLQNIHRKTVHNRNIYHTTRRCRHGYY
jgi:hypothetical protein